MDGVFLKYYRDLTNFMNYTTIGCLGFEIFFVFFDGWVVFKGHFRNPNKGNGIRDRKKFKNHSIISIIPYVPLPKPIKTVSRKLRKHLISHRPAPHSHSVRIEAIPLSNPIPVPILYIPNFPDSRSLKLPYPYSCHNTKNILMLSYELESTRRWDVWPWSFQSCGTGCQKYGHQEV